MNPSPFENFSLDALNSEQKPSVKYRSTGVDFEIYLPGRVEKILTGSISGALKFVFYCIVETFAFRVTARLEDPKPVT